MEQGKILKVTLEFENVKYVAEGKDAESWESRVDSAETLLHTHGGGEWNQWTRIEEKGLKEIEIERKRVILRNLIERYLLSEES